MSGDYDQRKADQFLAIFVIVIVLLAVAGAIFYEAAT
jgi:uncharacterized protein (DUF983 family)